MTPTLRDSCGCWGAVAGGMCGIGDGSGGGGEKGAVSVEAVRHAASDTGEHGSRRRTGWRTSWRSGSMLAEGKRLMTTSSRRSGARTSPCSRNSSLSNGECKAKSVHE